MPLSIVFMPASVAARHKYKYNYKHNTHGAKPATRRAGKQGRTDMSRIKLLIGACVVLLLGGGAGLWALTRGPAGTDEAQIVGQIRRGQQAAEMLSTAGLMRLVSAEYKDENGVTRPVLGYQTREQLRDAQSLEVAIPLNKIRLRIAASRREATTAFPVKLRFTDKQGGAHTLTLDPTLQWRKERGRRYLLFPTEEWLVVRADGLGNGMQ